MMSDSGQHWPESLGIPRKTLFDRPEWLPEGWKVEIKTRKGGWTAGRKDKVCANDYCNLENYPIGRLVGRDAIDYSGGGLLIVLEASLVVYKLCAKQCRRIPPRDSTSIPDF